MQSTVEVVCVGNGSNRTYNSVYTDPGVCKMVIVQDDDKFPSPRLCLLRRWPNFEGGFGFSLYEDLISSGALKVEEVVRHSPAEAGGLRKNDVIVEINRENIELKSFFPLVEILKEAFGQNDMELLVLAEQDAQWYRLRNITVNNNFPNIEYCETPYYGHILKPLDSFLTQPKLGNSQIEFHSSTGKLFRTTLVIDKERDSVYRRVEELPSNAPQAVDPTIPPLRPDGTFRHPGADNGSVRVYYRRDHTYQLPQTVNGEELNADSGLGSLRNRSTPNNLNNTTMSPFSTLGKSNDIGVDLLHDRWADLMDKYLDDKFRSGSVPRVEKHERPDRDTSVSKKTHIIRLNDPNATISTKSRSKSRCQSPNDASFSYLYSGRDDYQTASATSFKDINRQQSPFQNRGSPQTQSHNRFTSPNHVQSPVKQKYPIQVTGHKSRPQQQVNQPTTSSYQYDSSSYTATTTTYKPSYQQQNYTSTYTSTSKSRDASPSNVIINDANRTSGSSSINLTRPNVQQQYVTSCSNQLGFQLDETEVRTKGVYFVKSVELNSPSAMAGLKEGDKITKINGKSTIGMDYEQFCEEILIAQQQQLKNNMIHLMVMRKSAKSSGIGSYSSISKSGPTVLPIKNYSKDKSSSFVDEGYGHDSATSSTTTTAAISSSSNKNLISLVRVTSPSSQLNDEKLRPVQNVEIVSHESHTASVKPINVIYDSVVHEAQSVKETVIKPQVSESTPSNSNVLLQKYEREQKEREQKEREQKEREQKEREQKEREQREKERLEREQREKERLEREQREREERERLERIEFEKKMREQEEYERLERIQREKEMREREEREKAQRDREREQARQEFERQIKEKREREEKEKREELERQDLLKTKSDPETALSALTSIIVTGNQPIKKPLGLQEEITETSTTSEVYKIRQDSREEITHRVSTHELNNEIIETEYTDEYIQQDEQVSYESSSQISDEDEQRRIYAEFERQQEVMEILYKYITHPTIQDKLEKHRIYNQEGYFGYGMSFHQEPVSPSLPSHKLVYPRIELEPDSPSVDAGLKSDQRVVAVNGKLVNVEFNTLDDIAQEIEESYYDAKYTDLTVMSPDLWNRFMENPVYVSEIVSIKPEHVQAVQQVPKPVVEEIVHVTKEIVSKEIPIDDVDPKRPRLIRLVRTPRDEQFGFDFKTIKPDMRYVASSVQPNLPAHRAGLKDHDNILEVNGEFIHGMEHDAVVKKIKSIPDKVDLLVVTDINEYFALVDKAKRDQVKLQQFKPESPISVHDEVNIDLRVPHIKYYKVRTDPNYKGLGISLTPNGIISSIDPESPSDRAGLRKDQRIVEVDRVDVRDKSNTEIARLIKSKDNLEIGVVDVDPSETSADVSPASVRPTKDQTVPEVLISSISSATGQKLKGSSNKLSGSQSNLTYLKSKFGSCLGLTDDEETPKKDIKSKKIDQLTGARVCHLVRRPDFNGFGFSMRPNESGPHQISGVEENSPAEQSGLRVDDLILKVNDQNIIGDRYSKTTALIKNECEKGRLKLEVIETKLCPPEVRNTPLTPPSGYSTISSSSNKKNKSDSISNLRAITTEMVQQTSPKTRAVSADTGADRSKRPYSMTDLDRIPGNSTIRSITSIGTTATGFSQSNLANISSKSAGNLSTITNELPKFKRCVVQIIPEYKDGYGFTLNSKIKPKYMIFTVDPESPAYAANLRPTDVIVEIDKKNIRRLKFEKVRNMLTESRKRGQVEILAISKEGYLYFKNKKKKFSSTKLVTVDNTELHSTFDGIRTRESSVNNNRVSLEVEGDKRAQSAGIVYSRPSTENLNQQRPHSVSPTPSTQAVELDLDDVIICTIKRREDNPSIGLSLSPGGNRSVSKSTGKSVDTNNLYPVVTSVDAGSPAEEAGLRAGDVVIEINGKSTFGQPNSVIRLWIQEAGQQIEFTVKREKSSDERLMESAKIITNTVVQSAVQKLEASSPSSVHRLSRKDSFSSKTQSPQPSRVATLEESYMSSSKYQDFPSGQAISPRPVRNQSEPAPQDETSKSSTNLQTAESPISRRSLSSYTLPRDAPIPRLCRVRAYEEQLGFTVSGSKTNPGVFKVTEVATNSAAANSGLKNDDYIIEVSGVNVENLDYNELVGFIRKKKQDDDLQLLVADRQTLEWYKQKKIPISSNVVPKMQYIETLLKEELDRELNSTDLDQSGLNTSEQLRSSDKKIKVPFQPGRSVWIHRKIYLCHQPVSTLSYSMNDLSQANNV